MKSVSRYKLLLCFRPVMDMEAVLESERHDYIPSTSCDSVTSGSTRNKKRSLSRAVKATSFGAVLKRSENRTESARSKRSSSTDLERRPLMGVSDSSSSISSIETKKEEKTHEVSAPTQGSSNMEDGLCLLLISLLITVWLGRFCAILFTSVWLSFIPRKTIRDQSTKLAPAVTTTEAKSVPTKGNA